ncbi:MULTISPECIES: L-threonylcarbamoyladenylate synthase [Bacillus]|uniref:Threonylcarbamoyl-AMP synthase n=2 Tax=Bacillus cereus group TaxID=86661 RepID=Q72XC6_BACC1|nr:MULTISPECIES: L-threonylcarbamoyladenylate synthase [Bacillus]AAS44352.1 sua5/yciO/yrdC/ywlC family protein [Bacillus cereus ATCC 10987]KMQ33364.1 tRNA threonylcarbamoyladenosine biosynthesis protein [Bacillus cereus]KXY72051.1 tRNA threonylcarbamoyladenosine biosynthesis protein [Bacillus cereus]KYQ02348.1 TsaC protein (YrdC-Sua5 domain) required for threonylcarbamoyladenosine t(6)A37 modification in tRNA [Bacillus cereus]MCU5155312.1 L-threonylcarbamoyladenylate synthase [Bacillus pacific
MHTNMWVVDNVVERKKYYPQLQEAAKLLRENEAIAFPTETVYGLGANAMNDEAIAKIFEAKGRPSDNPLIVHIGTKSQLDGIVKEIPPVAEKLMEHFWPGPLTIILPRKEGISEKVTAGLNTVGVRMPDHPVALALIEEANVPVAAPSANRSGRPSPTLASHVYEDLNEKIAGIVDGGATGVGVESTVIDCTSAVPTILRPGGITKEQLESVIGTVSLDPALKDEKEKPKSPGMKYTHYAPKAPLSIVEGSREFIQRLADEKKEEGFKVGVLTTEEYQHVYNADVVLSCGVRSDLASVATKLYDVLRTFDASEVDVIFSESFPNEGIGNAIMNRLTKAAGHQIITE